MTKRPDDLVGDITKLKRFKFYWAPPMKYYDEGDLSFFEQEYGFVVQEVEGSHDGIIITGNAYEETEEFDADLIRAENKRSYFFEVDQSKVPDNMRQRVIRAFFEDKIYVKSYLEGKR